MSNEEKHPALATGNVAVITGGSRGIGFAAARRFTTLGMKVCIVDVHGLDDARAALGGVLAIQADVADRRAMENLASQVERELGPVSVLMNNAGIVGGGDALSNPSGWDRVLGVNLMGVLHGVQAFGPAMVERGAPGLVINTGSKQGITQPPGDTAYNVSKSGVKSLTEGLAHTLRQKGGHVTAHLLIPGFTYTGINSQHTTGKPDAAWTADQVVDRMMKGLARGEFYILCEDNETTRELDEMRIQWAADDIIQNRPALSRWHPDYAEAFQRYIASG